SALDGSGSPRRGPARGGRLAGEGSSGQDIRSVGTGILQPSVRGAEEDRWVQVDLQSKKPESFCGPAQVQNGDFALCAGMFAARGVYSQCRSSRRVFTRSF